MLTLSLGPYLYVCRRAKDGEWLGIRGLGFPEQKLHVRKAPRWIFLGPLCTLYFVKKLQCFHHLTNCRSFRRVVMPAPSEEVLHLCSELSVLRKLWSLPPRYQESSHGA